MKLPLRLAHFLQGGTRKRVSRFYRKLIPAGSLCFDIGANTGTKTEAFLSVPASVVAVEPDFDLCQGIEKKFPWKVNIENCGISDHEGDEIFFKGNNNEVSTFSPEFIEAFSWQKFLKWEAAGKVRVTTLDALIQKHGEPFFIKIDTEGYEGKALAGLSRAVPLVEFEYTAPFFQVAVHCVQRLQSLGRYEFNFSPYESFEWQSPSWISAEEMAEKIQDPSLAGLKETILHGNIFARSLRP